MGLRINWYGPGVRPNYRRDQLIRIIREFRTGRFVSVWIGNIRIGRK